MSVNLNSAFGFGVVSAKIIFNNDHFGVVKYKGNYNINKLSTPAASAIVQAKYELADRPSPSKKEIIEILNILKDANLDVGLETEMWLVKNE